MEAARYSNGQEDLPTEIEILRARLEEAEDIIYAIRNGSVDALAVQGPEGPHIFTLKDSNHTYRTLIEEMNEGAITLDQKAVILYSNACFASLVNRTLEQVIGASFYEFIPTTFRKPFEELFQLGWAGKSKGEIPLKSESGVLLPFSKKFKPSKTWSIFRMPSSIKRTKRYDIRKSPGKRQSNSVC